MPQAILERHRVQFSAKLQAKLEKERAKRSKAQAERERYLREQCSVIDTDTPWRSSARLKHRFLADPHRSRASALDPEE